MKALATHQGSLHSSYSIRIRRLKWTGEGSWLISHIAWMRYEGLGLVWLCRLCERREKGTGVYHNTRSVEAFLEKTAIAYPPCSKKGAIFSIRI